MEESEPRITYSKRFWRLNSIEGLKAVFRCECEALDEEHLARIRANNVELRQLESEEQAVQSRYRRILENRDL